MESDGLQHSSDFQLVQDRNIIKESIFSTIGRIDMAVNVKVPSDLTRVKEKVAFGLTKRQIICFSLAALIGLPVFFLVKKLKVDISVPTFSMMAVMMPLFFVAMYEKNGDTLELIIQRFLEFKFGKNQETKLFDRMYKVS